VSSVDFHLVPTMNPDGFERATEGDCDGQDLKAGRSNSNDVKSLKTHSKVIFPGDKVWKSLIMGIGP
jgi:hypothetical protein